MVKYFFGCFKNKRENVLNKFHYVFCTHLNSSLFKNLFIDELQTVIVIILFAILAGNQCLRCTYTAQAKTLYLLFFSFSSPLVQQNGFFVKE